MIINLYLPPLSIPEVDSEHLDWPRFHEIYVDFFVFWLFIY